MVVEAGANAKRLEPTGSHFEALGVHELNKLHITNLFEATRCFSTLYVPVHELGRSFRDCDFVNSSGRSGRTRYN
jgi:hypothetical protein